MMRNFNATGVAAGASLNIQGTIDLPDTFPTVTRYVSADEAVLTIVLAGLLGRADSYLLTDQELVEKACGMVKLVQTEARKQGLSI